MRCPACSCDLQILVRSGVEIDYCPVCRGVWLDRGELDKIVERSGCITEAGRLADDRERHYASFKASPPQESSRQESFLTELFDLG